MVAMTEVLADATWQLLCHDAEAPGRDAFAFAFETSGGGGAQRSGNVHLREGINEETFVAMRTARDPTLTMPRPIVPAIQVNMHGGRLPEPEPKWNPVARSRSRPAPALARCSAAPPDPQDLHP
jgi:hypothetical protein